VDEKKEPAASNGGQEKADTKYFNARPIRTSMPPDAKFPLIGNARAFDALAAMRSKLLRRRGGR
jgi:hypothetical protein